MTQHRPQNHDANRDRLSKQQYNDGIFININEMQINMWQVRCRKYEGWHRGTGKLPK